MSRSYPFVPTRHSQLEAGQYWSIPLSTGRFGCGLIMETDEMIGVSYFHGLLLDWIGDTHPTAADVLAANGYLEARSCGVRAISTGDGRIEGQIDVSDLPFQLPLEVEIEPNNTESVYRGSEYIRPATPHDHTTLDRRLMGSVGSFRVSAERRLVNTKRLITLWKPHPEVNYGKLHDLFEPLGPVERGAFRLGPLDDEKVFYANNPKRRQLIGENWYHGPAAHYLNQGLVPTIFQYQPGSQLAKQAMNAAITKWDGYVDNTIDPIMTTQEFTNHYPLNQHWPFLS